MRNKYKIVFLGNAFVGKTTLISQILYNHTIKSYNPTIGIDFISTRLKIRGEDVRIQLWDTAGQERFRSLLKTYTRDCFLAVLVYDLCNKESFNGLEEMINEYIDKDKVGNDTKILLVGNKTDLFEEMQNERKKMENIKKEKGIEREFLVDKILNENKDNEVGNENCRDNKEVGSENCRDIKEVSGENEVGNENCRDIKEVSSENEVGNNKEVNNKEVNSGNCSDIKEFGSNENEENSFETDSDKTIEKTRGDTNKEKDLDFTTNVKVENHNLGKKNINSFIKTDQVDFNNNQTEPTKVKGSIKQKKPDSKECYKFDANTKENVLNFFKIIKNGNDIDESKIIGKDKFSITTCAFNNDDIKKLISAMVAIIDKDIQESGNIIDFDNENDNIFIGTKQKKRCCW